MATLSESYAVDGLGQSTIVWNSRTKEGPYLAVVRAGLRMMIMIMLVDQYLTRRTVFSVQSKKLHGSVLRKLRFFR